MDVKYLGSLPWPDSIVDWREEGVQVETNNSIGIGEICIVLATMNRLCMSARSYILVDRDNLAHLITLLFLLGRSRRPKQFFHVALLRLHSSFQIL